MAPERGATERVGRVGALPRGPDRGLLGRRVHGVRRPRLVRDRLRGSHEDQARLCSAARDRRPARGVGARSILAPHRPRTGRPHGLLRGRRAARRGVWPSCRSSTPSAAAQPPRRSRGDQRARHSRRVRHGRPHRPPGLRRKLRALPQHGPARLFARVPDAGGAGTADRSASRRRPSRRTAPPDPRRPPRSTGAAADGPASEGAWTQRPRHGCSSASPRGARTTRH